MMKCLRLILLSVTIFPIMPVFAEETNIAKLTFGENKWIAMHYLLQAQAYTQNIYDSDAGETEVDSVWSKGFQVRKSRIILKGQVAENVTFFMETDDFKIGNSGTAEQYGTDKMGVFTQDAFISYKIADELQIAVGMILLPFMHHSRASSVSLLCLDFNSLVVPLLETTNVWRDTGVELRGLLLPTLNDKKGLIDYKVGIFRGKVDRDLQGTHVTSDDINPDSNPRYCGRVQINLLDSETGFFYSDNYLGKKKVLSFGAAVDFQKDTILITDNIATAQRGNPVTILKNYKAMTADVIFDYPLADGMAIAVQGAYVDVKNKPGSLDADGNQLRKENGYFIQGGLLVGGFVQPVVKYMKWIKEKATKSSLAGAIPSMPCDDDYKKAYMVFGVNFFLNGHNANIKAEWQQPMKSDHWADSGEKKGTIQCQIFI